MGHRASWAGLRAVDRGDILLGSRKDRDWAGLRAGRSLGSLLLGSKLSRRWAGLRAGRSSKIVGVGLTGPKGNLSGGPSGKIVPA